MIFFFFHSCNGGGVFFLGIEEREREKERGEREKALKFRCKKKKALNECIFLLGYLYYFNGLVILF